MWALLLASKIRQEEIWSQDLYTQQMGTCGAILNLFNALSENTSLLHKGPWSTYTYTFKKKLDPLPLLKQKIYPSPSFTQTLDSTHAFTKKLDPPLTWFSVSLSFITSLNLWRSPSRDRLPSSSLVQRFSASSRAILRAFLFSSKRDSLARSLAIFSW